MTPIYKCPTCGGQGCATCQECHQCGAKQSSTGVPAAVSVPKVDLFVTSPLSQKIKGLQALLKYSCGLSATPIIAVLDSTSLREGKEKLIEALENLGGNPSSFCFFCRPSPVFPRHGFVDSRVCSTPKAIVRLLEETLEADPKGELMLTRPIDATHNAIWTPNLFTVGLGNDGATGGKNVTSIPLSGTHLLTLTLLKAAGITKAADPYIELIWGSEPSYSPLVTQLRAGPKVNSTAPDYVPLPMIITKVIRTAGETLLAWEKIVTTLGIGDVIYHPGGGVTDHWFVHARLSGIPVFTTREPKVGEHIEAQINQSLLPSPESVCRGAFGAELVPLNQERAKAATHLLLVGLHHSGAMHGDHGKWIGAAVMLMLRLGAVALRGEARHRIGGKSGVSRDAVYEKCFNKPLAYHRASLTRHALLFRYGQWSGSYGGHKWAQCAYAMEPLYNALRQLILEPTDQNVVMLTKALNVAVNQVHNNGWWLNKFTTSDVLSHIPKGDLKAISVIGPFAYELDQHIKSLTSTQVAQMVHQWQTQGCTQIKVLPLQSASARYTPGASTVTVEFTSRLLGKNHKRMIQVPLSSIMGNLLTTLGNLRVRPEKGALTVECQIGDKPPTTLWTEPSIFQEKT